MRKAIRIRGQGGQGAITFGYIFGRAAALYEDLEAVLTEAYGAEITGGFAKADVLIKDQPINYPLVDIPDLFIAMSQEAWDEEKNNLMDDSVIIYEKKLVIPEATIIANKKAYGIPALELAVELKNKVVMNVILMAATQEITGIISKESLKKALLDRIPKRFEELNLNALEVGYKYAKELLASNGGI